MLQDFLFSIFLAGICFVLVGGMFIIAGVVVIIRKGRIAEPIALSWIWFLLGALTIVGGAYLLYIFLTF